MRFISADEDPYFELIYKAEMISGNQKSQLERAIDRIPEFRGAGIGFFEYGSYRRLRGSNHPTGLHTLVVIEEKTRATSAVSPQSVPRHLGPELAGAGINCLGMVLSGVAAGAEALSTPLTAGSSAALLLVTVPVASASALQCGLSLGRVSNSIFSPENNQDLDSSEWFTRMSVALDGIALLDAVHGAGEVSRLAIQLRRSSSRPFVDIISSMTRAERKQLAEEIGRYTRAYFINRFGLMADTSG